MNRIDNIVSTLLDLTEDLESKLPILLKQFPEFSDEQIREISQADPTSPARAEYVTWLLRMRREGMWKVDTDDMRDLLTKYSAVKKKPRFIQVGGLTDINQYNSVTSMRAHVEAALKEDFDEAKVKAGTSVVGKANGMVIFKVEPNNFEAARAIAIRPGQPAPDNADFSDIKQHAGTGEPGWPWTSWCTQLDAHYRNYANHPLYVVMKGKKPYVQVQFETSQANDIKDVPIDPVVAQEVAPLFSVSEFNKYVGRGIDEKKLIDKCRQMVLTYVARNVRGYNDPKLNKFVQPKIKTEAEALDKLRAYIPRTYQMFIDVAKNFNSPRDERDANIIDDIKAKPVNRGTSGVGAILNAVASMPLTGSDLPPMLQSLEAFTSRFEKLLKK